MKTKLLLMVFFALAVTNIFAQTKNEILTNKKIIELAGIGLPSSSIVTKIQNSQTNFDVSTDALIELKKQGVSGDVISEMITAQSKANSQVSIQKDMNDPLSKRAMGIYYYNPNDNAKKLKRVDPTVTATNKSGGFGSALAQAYSYGLAKSEVTSSLSGANSHFQLEEKEPAFYFYFESNANAGGDSWFFATATSPNEFVLVKLTERKDNREMVVGDMNAYGSSTGVPNKIKISFDYEEVAEGIYKVIPKQPLLKGEYCFIYASSTPTQYSNNKVFDFGIKNNNGDNGKTSENKPNKVY